MYKEYKNEHVFYSATFHSLFYHSGKEHNILKCETTELHLMHSQLFFP